MYLVDLPCAVWCALMGPLLKGVSAGPVSTPELRHQMGSVCVEAMLIALSKVGSYSMLPRSCVSLSKVLCRFDPGF